MGHADSAQAQYIISHLPTPSPFASTNARRIGIALLQSRRTGTSSLRAASTSALLSSNLTPSFVGGSVINFSGQKIRPASLNPALIFDSRGKRSFVTMVIPFSRGCLGATSSGFGVYKYRIVYLGMPLVLSVRELILAEFLYLQYEDETRPIQFQKGASKALASRLARRLIASVASVASVAFCFILFLIIFLRQNDDVLSIFRVLFRASSM